MLTSGKSWLVAPVVALVGLGVLLLLWGVAEPQAYLEWFQLKEGLSPVEWMTLPLFGLIVPLVWTCPPNSGGLRRQCAWSALWSVLGLIALVRETDLHKLAFARLWPEVADSFPGTVFKMRFLKADAVPLMPKLFVIMVFVIFFVAVGLPLLRYLVPLLKGFFRMEPVAWSAAPFGVVSAFVLVVDRLPANLRKWGIVNLKAPGHEAGLALCKGLEEGAEMVMALLALLTIVHSYLTFVHARKENP